MWLKALGSSLVIMTGIYIGFTLAARCTERPHQIRQIVSCIVTLKAYINYISLPLSEALVKCTDGTDGVIAKFFMGVSRKLEENRWMNPEEAMKQTMSNLGSQLVIEQPEREVLLMMGANLGTMNKTEQEKYLTMVQEQLEQLEQGAVRIRDQNTKMYRYLGICGSLVIVLLLI